MCSADCRLMDQGGWAFLQWQVQIPSAAKGPSTTRGWQAALWILLGLAPGVILPAVRFDVAGGTI